MCVCVRVFKCVFDASMIPWLSNKNGGFRLVIGLPPVIIHMFNRMFQEINDGTSMGIPQVRWMVFVRDIPLKMDDEQGVPP